MSDQIFAPSWDEYLADVADLCEIIRSAQVSVSAVFGIPPHGVIPAFLISQQMRIEFAQLALQHRMAGGSLLCVNGITNQGDSLVAYYRDFKTASVYVRDRPDVRLRPHYHARIIESRVQFPYEPRTSRQRALGDPTFVQRP